MRRATHPAWLVLITAAALLASCSAPPPSAKKQLETTPAQPVPLAPSTTAPAVDLSAINQSIASNVGDPAKFRAVMTSLQQAVAKHDSNAVAALISYPVTINPGTRTPMRIRTPDAFVTSYDKIITPHIADVVKEQRYEDLFVNAQGAMFGNGEVWITGTCRDKTCTQTDIKIRTIQNTDAQTH
jgi:hypothetical protein